MPPFPAFPRPFPAGIRFSTLLPGLLLAGAFAALAQAASRLPGASALSAAVLAILIGFAVGRACGGMPAWAAPGAAFAMRGPLRLGVALLGLKVTLADLAALGPATVLAVAASLAICFCTTSWLGPLMGVPRPLSRLIAIGTAVCGASAILAGRDAIGAEDGDVAYALAMVSVMGTVAMLALPILALALGLSPDRAGPWLGASIHEVAQVAGAASQLGPEALTTATIAKMARISLLAPLVLVLCAGRPEGRTGRGPGLPWFVTAFLVLSVVASTGVVPAPLVAGAADLSGFLLAAALGAMGLALDPAALKAKGVRPVLLALVSALVIAATSFAFLVLAAH